MPNKVEILFIGKNPVIARKFKLHIQRHVPHCKCHIATNKYAIQRLKPWDLRRFKRIVIHQERGEHFPNASMVNRLFHLYPDKNKFLLYKYPPFTLSDINTVYADLLVRRYHSISP